jgi:L-asparaginase
LLKLGRLPLAADPAKPTEQETEATKKMVTRYQEIFDSH